MADYEITYILKPSMEEAAVEARSVSVGEIVTKGGGTVGTIELLGKKRLAYEIQDLREGYYVIMGFQADAATGKELERQLKLDENVLRGLLISLDKKQLAHMAAGGHISPPAPPREEYSGRGGDRGGYRPRGEDRGEYRPRDDRGDRD